MQSQRSNKLTLFLLPSRQSCPRHCPFRNTLTQFPVAQNCHMYGFPDGTVVKNAPANAGDTRHAGSIPGLGRSPGEGNGDPLQYSCLEHPTDRGAWWAIVHGFTRVGHDFSD